MTLANLTITNPLINLSSLPNYLIYKRRLIIISSALFFLLVILEIWALNRLSTSGEQINRFERASSSLKIENQILGNKIAKLTSLQEIETKSLLLGFRPIKRVEYLKTSDIALGH